MSLTQQGMPDYCKGKTLLLIRRKSTGVVIGYHQIDVDPHILQGLLHGILFTFKRYENLPRV